MEISSLNFFICLVIAVIVVGAFNIEAYVSDKRNGYLFNEFYKDSLKCFPIEAEDQILENLENDN